MIQPKKKIVNLHIPQLVFDLAPQPKKYLEAGRGWGKSTILGKKMRDFVVNLPRTTIALVGVTYSQILSKTLPSTIEGLEMFGCIIGIKIYISYIKFIKIHYSI